MKDLAALLQPFDEAALAVLTSPGLVRRAGKEVVEAAGDGFAVGNETVTFDPAVIAKRGLEAGTTCTCPATGLCRHAIAAVLHARLQTVAPVAETDAFDEIAALSEEDLRAFAGSHWWAAVDAVVVLRREGGNVLASVAARRGAAVDVVLQPGRPLAQALVKGPDSARKKAIAAAAIAVRREAHPDWSPTGEAPGELSAPFLRDVACEIEAAFAAGASPAAEDDLRLLAASSAAERAPRLAAVLNAAAQEGQRARERQLDTSAQTVMLALAEARALVAALLARPDDDRLAGRPAPWIDAPPLQAWCVGARVWRSAAGARGLDGILYDAEAQRFLSVGEARRAGQDPAFEPTAVYRANTLPALRPGRMVTLAAPQISEGMPPRIRGAAKADAALTREIVADWPIAYDDWAALRAAAADLPLGLDALRERLHALLLPRRMRRPELDALGQRLVWDMEDENDTLALALPLDGSAAHDLAKRMRASFAREVDPMPVLVEISRRDPEGSGENLLFRPIAVMPETDGVLAVVNLELDRLPPLPARFDLAPALSRLRTAFGAAVGGTEPDEPAARERNETEHQALAAAALDLAETVPRTRRAGGERLADGARSLATRSDGLGLASLAAALRSLADAPGPETALRVAWLARRVRLAA